MYGDIWLFSEIFKKGSLNNQEFFKYTAEIYPKKLTLNNANLNDNYCPFLDLDISVSHGKLHTKIYDKRDDFSFPIVNFPFLDGVVPLAPSYGVYISQLVRYARVCCDVFDFNERNICITSKLLNQGFRYHKLLKTFTKFFRRYKDLVLKFGCTCRKLISNGIAHPHFYIVNRAQTFRNDPGKLIGPLNKLILKGYQFNTVIRSLNIVFIGINIDFFLDIN